MSQMLGLLCVSVAVATARSCPRSHQAMRKLRLHAEELEWLMQLGEEYNNRSIVLVQDMVEELWYCV